MRLSSPTVRQRRRHRRGRQRRKPKNPIEKNHSKLINIISPIVLFLFLGISSRGGLQERPVTPGHAYFSDKDMMANHLAVNSVHNYIHSIMQSLNEPDLLFYSNSDKTTRDVINENRLNNNERKNQNSQKELPNIIPVFLIIVILS